MNIEYLSEFILLAEILNFGETARELFITTSTLSKHIASIEEEIGVKLLDRNSSQTALTEAGRVFYTGAKQTVTMYRYAKQCAQNASGASERTLRVGYIYGAGKPWLKRFQAKLESEFPDMRINASCMSVDEMCDALIMKNLDVAFSIDHVRANPEYYDSAILHSAPICVLVPASHPLAAKDKASLEEIVNEPLIIPNPITQESAYRHYTSMFTKPVNPIGYYNNPQSLFLNVEIGLGVGLISLIAEEDCNVPGLTFVPLDLDGPTTNVVLLSRVNLDDLTKERIARVRDLLKADEHPRSYGLGVG